MRASETAEMIFEDCFVSEDNVLGEVGEGFIQAMKILDGGRISIAALSLGISIEDVCMGLSDSTQVPGRMEQINNNLKHFQIFSLYQN